MNKLFFILLIIGFVGLAFANDNLNKGVRFGGSSYKGHRSPYYGNSYNHDNYGYDNNDGYDRYNNYGHNNYGHNSYGGYQQGY